ncbi:MAG TPA: hypothetical protein VNM67_20540 [Thermoanaerobaculia bacterium]|nr:hypothetical protein [Thermoanaerobaculia bacterium]
MKDQAQADHLARWDTALVAGEVNDTEPGLGDLMVELGTATEGARTCINRRANLKYLLQQNTRDLDEFMAKGKEAYARVSYVVKGRYGIRAEKLAEYGLQPRRPALKSKVETPPVETEKPPVKGQSPSQAANSQTESTN